MEQHDSESITLPPLGKHNENENNEATLDDSNESQPKFSDDKHDNDNSKKRRLMQPNETLSSTSAPKKKQRHGGRKMKYLPNKNDLIRADDCYWYHSFICPCKAVLTIFSAYHHYNGSRCHEYNSF